MADVAQGQSLLCAQALLALQLQSLVGYLAGFLFRLEHVECVAGRWRSVESQYDCRLCRLCLFDALVALVEHCLDASVVGSGYYDVAYAQRTVAYEHC